jgi:hypothetical protein
MDSFFPKIGMESQCLNRINQRLVTLSPTFKRYVKERGHVERGERGFNTSCHDKRGKHGDFTMGVAKVIVSDYRYFFRGKYSNLTTDGHRVEPRRRW